MAEVSLAETKRLGNDLLTSRLNVNNAPLLLSILSSNSASTSSATASNSSSPLTQCRLEALRSLHAFFIPLLRTGEFFAAARNKAKQGVEAVAATVKDAGGGHYSDGGGGDTSGRAEAVYRLWVWNKYREFKKSLFRIVAQQTDLHVLQVTAINTLMDLVREGRSGEFNNTLYLQLCARMVGSKGQNNDILQVLIAKYFKYSDVRYFTHSNMEKLVVKRLGTKRRDNEIVSSDEDNNQELVGASSNTFVRNVYDVLLHLPPPSNNNQKDEDAAETYWSDSLGGKGREKAFTGTDEEKTKTKRNKSSPSDDNLRIQKYTRKHKSVMSKAWLAFLQLSIPLDIYKKVLARLPRNVIPYMTNPILLSDFLTRSYNTGGLISVMALDSLFILITKHGLEYPDFYNKLYALLEPSIFVARYRSRFFELLDTCLKSSHLPGYLSAAFAKRLGRLVLTAPPSGAIVVIALIHNLLRRHPSINVLVHQPESNQVPAVLRVDAGNDQESGDASNLEERQDTHDKIPEGRLGADPFIANEADTSKCNALKSSLWEIEALRRHYCPAVSRFVESLETDLTVRAKTTEVVIRDFSSASYATIFSEEVGRRLKSVPVAFYSTVPNTLFPGSSFDDSFDGWKFEGSSRLHLESLDDSKSNEAQDTVNEVQEGGNMIEEGGDEDSVEDAHSEELSSDGSGGSRSRSEQSEGDDWPRPLLKRLRGT